MALGLLALCLAYCAMCFIVILQAINAYGGDYECSFFFAFVIFFRKNNKCKEIYKTKQALTFLGVFSETRLIQNTGLFDYIERE